ncbi:hypothetical protein F7725_013122 [Dissostichus mawsoni]|uniref:Uncharacterized protein n=1 Tax=Dissostichus mawsoni TaxID=36200 RepID=A0A7J5YPP1_DISMA|nr:hypothetical protein F7725_013122 [Dissostichus mawsoni]
MKLNMHYTFKVLDGVLKSETIMNNDLVAEILGIPLVFSLRFSIANICERHCGQPLLLPPLSLEL